MYLASCTAPLQYFLDHFSVPTNVAVVDNSESYPGCVPSSLTAGTIEYKHIAHHGQEMGGEGHTWSHME